MSKYILQTYKEKRKVYPYEETIAYYYGPKESWMKEVKNDKRKTLTLVTMESFFKKPFFLYFSHS